MKKDDLTTVQQEELTAAQRILLAQGKGLYEFKGVQLSFSLRTHAITGSLIWLIILAGFILVLLKEVLLKNTGYATVIILGVYLILVGKHVIDSWRDYLHKTKTINRAD